MKTAETKIAMASIQRKENNTQSPFFKKEGDTSFLSDIATQSETASPPFFTPTTVAQPSIQTKLTIGEPNDKYEQEADRVADSVVQKMADPSFSADAVSQSSTANVIQHKCSDCEDKERLQKKEGEEEMISKKEIGLQRKPIFESGGDEEISSSASGIQRKCASCGKEEDDHIQEKSETSGSNTVYPDLQSRLNSTKGGGAALPKETAASMGAAMGADFSGVRVHTDSKAVEMNRELGAQAFTHGRDVYFNEGKYDTGSSGGGAFVGA